MKTRTILLTTLLTACGGAYEAQPETIGASAHALTHFGEFKLRINATNAEMWKAKWWCVNGDGSLSLIDADTFPASSQTTRTTNITSDKCTSGRWKVSFEVKRNGNWREVKPGGGVCNYPSFCGYYPSTSLPIIPDFREYAEDTDWTNDSSKLCVLAINEWWDKLQVMKEPCGG